VGGNWDGEARGRAAQQVQGSGSVFPMAAVDKKKNGDNKKEAAGCHCLHVPWEMWVRRKFLP